MIPVAVCFYTPEDYAKLLEISDDRETMCDTYEEWLVQFTNARNGLEEEGLAVSPVRIKLDALKEFCEKNHLKNDGSARSKFASLLAKQLSELDQALRLSTDKNQIKFN